MNRTRSQRVAEAAYQVVQPRAQDQKTRRKYLGFARQFPTLIHTCGLAQATAFALAKGAKGDEPGLVLKDLEAVLIGTGDLGAADGQEEGSTLHTEALGRNLMDYVRLSRSALFAATWIKRYAEALVPEDQPAATGTPGAST